MESRDTSPVRILVVDDHPNTATMLARVLSKFDTPVEVITASSGEDALEKIDGQIVDILITDFMMPGINGLELIEKLEGDLKPTHTILITAYDTPGLVLSSRRLHVQDYLVKPVQPEKIRGIVSRVIDEIRPSRKVSTVAKRPFKILIADDYSDNIRLLSTRLRSEGYTFIPAWDGEETLRKTRAEDPDLILLDVNMPKKDGFQVLAEMRADPELAHIPVIIITAARIGPKDVREGLTLGADDYIVKPFDWRELAARIRSKLRVKEAEDILRRRNRELGLLPEIGQELSARLEVEDLASIIVDRTVEVLKATSARIDVFLSDGKVYCRERWAADDASTALEQTRRQVFSQGLVGHVVASHEGVVVEDISLDDRWRSGPHEELVSAIAVPLLGRKHVIGVITLTHTQPAFFNQDHQVLLQAIASQAAIAIENAQLFEAEHKRVQELTLLNQISQEINRFTYSSQVLQDLPRLIRDGLGYPVVAIWDGNAAQKEQLIPCSMVGDVENLDPDILLAVPRQVAESGSSIIHSDPSKVPSIIAVPLSLEGETRGVLAVYNACAEAFHESDLVLMENLSTQIAAALERVALFESVEQEQRRLSAVLRSAADAILVMDSQKCLTLTNPAGEGLFIDTNSGIGKPLPVGEGYDGLIDLLDRVRQSGTHQQGEINWPDGSTFSVIVTPIEEGGQVALLHDVSHFKALSELKNEYIATASHDLKNPIQAVLGYSELLAEAGELNPMQLGFSKRIRSSAFQMRDLVLNLLEISRLESGVAMAQEELNLHELLAEAAAELEIQVEAKGHTLSLELCEGQPRIKGDRTLFEQMVRNLLSNAIKYTPENGQIWVITQVDDSQVSIRFQDTGVGIPEEDLPYIFNKFFRVYTEATKDIEGTGLGLAIVKSIVENHNGQVNVESEVGKGTTFTVSLPVFLAS